MLSVPAASSCGMYGFTSAGVTPRSGPQTEVRCHATGNVEHRLLQPNAQDGPRRRRRQT